jgi:hypothetical protein
MKGGGADLHVLHREPINPNGEDWRGNIVNGARKCADFATEKAPLVGFVLVAMYADGGASVGYRYDLERCPVPRAAIPGWVSELIRRDMLTAPEARSVFDEMFYWQGGPTG